MPRRLRLLPVLFLVLALALVAPASPVEARNEVAGFNLDELIAQAGTGPDPGTGDLVERLRWGVATAVPRQWLEAVRVDWSVGNVGRGHLALSYRDGRIVISPRLMNRSSEEVLATVAHEMGHQIAFALVDPAFGTPPQVFVERAPGYNDIREGWSDCVARAWTGSTFHTLSESRPCSSETAQFVAGLLADPATLGATGRITPPPIQGRPVPPPAPAPAVPPEVVPEPAPAEALPIPLATAVDAPLPLTPKEPKPMPKPVAASAPADGSSTGLKLTGLLGGVLLLLAATCGAGYRLAHSRSDKILAWATGGGSAAGDVPKVKKPRVKKPRVKK